MAQLSGLGVEWCGGLTAHHFGEPVQAVFIGGLPDGAHRFGYRWVGKRLLPQHQRAVAIRSARDSELKKRLALVLTPLCG